MGVDGGSPWDRNERVSEYHEEARKMSEILGSITKVEDDDYQGKDFKKVTLANGQVLKVKYGREGSLRAKWELLQEGKAIKFIMGEYQGKPFVKDIESLAEQLQPAVNPNETGMPQQDEVDKALSEARTTLNTPNPQNRSYALSYAKDWCGVKVQGGEDIKTADVIRVAKEFAKYLDNG